MDAFSGRTVDGVGQYAFYGVAKCGVGSGELSFYGHPDTAVGILVCRADSDLGDKMFVILG